MAVGTNLWRAFIISSHPLLDTPNEYNAIKGVFRLKIVT